MARRAGRAGGATMIRPDLLDGDRRLSPIAEQTEARLREIDL